MTEHVRTTYRGHRKTTWALAIALAVLVAAVVIPLASGASDKTYEMTYPAGAVSPAPPAGGSSSQTLCTNTAYTLKIQIKNTAKTVSLGSANITYPSNVSVTSASFVSPSPGWQMLSYQAGSNLVRIRNLSLAKNAIVTVQVALTTGSSPTNGSPPGVSAVVKQSNNFNDTGGSANTFENPAFPTLALQDCNATISGRVYHDRDQSGGFAVNASSPTSDIAKAGWTVTLWRATGSGYDDVDSDSTEAGGTYSVEGPIGGNFRVCVSAAGNPPGPPDSATAWAVRQVDGVTLTTGCSDITPTSPDSSGLSVTNLPSAGKMGQDFAVVPVTVFDFEGGQSVGDGTSYVVQAAGNSDKAPQHYVKETWTDSSGRPYFVFAPINACTSDCEGEIFLLEQMGGSISQSDLGANKQVVLVYDDTEPFQTFRPMPYCLQDPRDGADLLESDVLPPPVGSEEEHTSCIVEGHQVVGDDPQDPEIGFTFLVYTSYDGSRGLN
jgi:hypothetical protein